VPAAAEEDTTIIFESTNDLGSPIFFLVLDARNVTIWTTAIILPG